jgi:Ser/Thr protein kinase RdoA (MazF antagonist)
VRRIQDGGNTHWSVRAGSERYVLRRYGTHRTLPQVSWEHDLLVRVAERGWPVACAIGEAVVVDGRVYSLFPFLGGARMRGADDHQRRRCGRILAEYHADVADLAVAPRPGKPKLWEFDADAIVQNEAVRSALGDPAATVLERHATSVAREFERLGVREFPRSVTHGDLAPWNLRFEGTALTALYDFDAADVDALAADVACGRRGYHDVFVDGYVDVHALSDEELAALAPLWIANVLQYVATLCIDTVGVGAWDRTELAWCRAQLDKTVPYRRV